jgi:hypothetical protein
VDSTGATDFSRDYIVEVPIINCTHGARNLATSIALTRLSIALIHLACCKAEKERKFKFCDIQGTFVLEEETSLQGFSMPSTPGSSISLLSPASGSSTGLATKRPRPDEEDLEEQEKRLNVSGGY